MVRRARTMSPLAPGPRPSAVAGLQAGIEAERIFEPDIEVLIFEAEDHVDQRAFVDHVVEAAAGIPAVVARLAVKLARLAVAKTGNLRASRCLEISRSIATRRKDHQTIPGVAQRGPTVNRLVILCSKNVLARPRRVEQTPLVLRHSLKHPLRAASTPRTQAPHCHCAPAWKPKMPSLGLVEKLFHFPVRRRS